MVWICSPSSENCIIRFYSIAGDLRVLNEAIFQYIANISPGIWIMILVISITSFIVALLMSIKMAIIRSGDLYGR